MVLICFELVFHWAIMIVVLSDSAISVNMDVGLASSRLMMHGQLFQARITLKQSYGCTVNVVLYAYGPDAAGTSSHP